MSIYADKPPIEELHQFLEFQLPRQWAPVFGDLPLGPQRRHLSFPSLQFSLLGPRLYVNTTPVSSLNFNTSISYRRPAMEQKVVYILLLLLV